MNAREPVNRRRNWRRARAESLRDAMDLCLAYALEKHNRGVERIADLMGLPSKFTLYKWMESARMPANLIPTFEHACGAHFVTEYLGLTAHKLLIDIPRGRAASHLDVAELQAAFAESIALLIRHQQGQATAENAMSALTRVMGGLAWQVENVAKDAQPELDLYGGDA